MTMLIITRERLAPGRILSYVAGLLAVAAALAINVSAQATVATYHNDNQRTGNNRLETTLTPSNVNSSEFGKLFSQTVDGFIYAQPLYVPNVKVGSVTHDIVFVATMNDSVYAFDADSNSGSNASPLWKVNFTNPAKGITTVSTTDVNCPDTITTEIGIMGTPVIDTSGGTIYVIARTKESGKFFQRLHALDITSGAEKFGGPIVIQASVSGTGKGSVKGTLSFNALIENQRSALLLQNGLVYVAWGSLCDKNTYHGWLMAYNSTTLAQTAVWVTTPNASEGAIWASGSGPAGDSSFNTFIPIANGTFDVNTSGKDYGQSMVKLGPPANNTFSVLDYFEPYDGTNLDTGDHDIGSGGMVLLPDQTGGPHLHLLVQSDKVGNIYLVDRDNMGQYNSQNNNQIVQYLPAANRGMWNSPTWWNNNVYFGASSDVLKAFAFNTTTGLLSTTPTSQSAKSFAYPGTTGSVSANQTTNGIFWALNNSGYKTTGAAVLHAYDATNLASELYNSGQNSTRDNPGPAVKFTVPTVANGKVYVGTQTKLSVFGLLADGPK
jgi:PQQ-like domain